MKEDNRQVLDSADLRDLFETNTEKLFRCNVCLKSYAKVTSYEAHLRIHNNVDAGLICHICGAQFDSLQEMKIHVATHNRSVQIFPCKLCGHVFPTLAARKRHKLNHLHSPEWTCEICSKKFKTHSFYTDHVLMHKVKKETPKYLCSVCGLVGEDENEMEEHKKSHEEKVILEESENYTIVEIPADGGNEFICGECGKGCPDIDTMNVHMEEHVQLGRYQCSECKLVFQYKYLLLQHERESHAEQRPYTCDICSTAFTSKNGLRNHRSTHLPLRYPCDECGNVFKGRSGLYLHKQRVHRGRKDFVCDYCGKTFALKCQKENHERVHTGEKPFKCETCGAGFKAQSGLYAHRKTHTDERPYKCEICGKHLRLPYNLRLHMRTHTGEKPYVCDICGRAFSQPGDCKKHKKTHRKNTEENVAAAAIDQTMRDEEKPEYVDVTYLTYALNA